MITFIFIVLGIVGLYAFGIGLTRSIRENNNKLFLRYFLMHLVGGMMAGTFFLLAGARAEKGSLQPIHSTKFKVNTEIKTELINGTEVSRDTIYKFIPKP